MENKSKHSLQAVEPKTVKGGPVVVEYTPDPRRPKKVKKTPEERKEKEKAKVLTETEFVEKYRNEVVTASWDPSVLKKCGRGAEEIFSTLGVPKKKQHLPYSALQQRRMKRLEDEELEGTRFMPKYTHDKKHKEQRKSQKLKAKKERQSKK